MSPSSAPESSLSLGAVTCTLTLLGCGTSTGVPVLGCCCRVCTSTDPRNKRLRTAAHLRTSSGISVAIDAGPDLRRQALRADITHLDGVIFTHAHADHILGIDDLRGFNFSSRRPLSCYASELTMSGIFSLFDYVINPDPAYRGSVPQLTFHPIEHGKPFSIRDLEVLPLEIVHGHLSVTMYRFGPVAYATDCSQIPPATGESLAGVEVLFLDALRSEPSPSHFTIDQACEVAQRLGIRRTILIHLSHSLDYNEISAKLPSGVELGYDGLEVSWRV
jgi:phosphoribosyl 1,2-cyclic phosphate phosphodiesterase